MKICSSCKSIKQETDFYKDNRNPSGLKSQCKNCHSKGNILTRDHENHKIKRRESMRRLRKIEPEKFRKRERLASLNRPKDIRVKARQILNRAISSGQISRPNVCQKCGKVGKVTGHHTDYSQPISVEWLCYQCHANVHFGGQI